MATALVPDALWSLADYFRPEGSTATELGPLHVPIVPMSAKAPVAASMGYIETLMHWGVSSVITSKAVNVSCLPTTGYETALVEPEACKAKPHQIPMTG